MKKPVSYINAYGNTVWTLESKGRHHFHREDGPAIIYSSKNSGRGRMPYAWAVDNQILNAKKVNAWMKANGFTKEDFGTPEFAVAFKLGFL